MKVATVNVIEYVNDEISIIHSFSDDQRGQNEAEFLFKDIIKDVDPEVTDEELEGFVKEGFHEQGDYQLFLTHSASGEQICSQDS